VVRAFDPVLRRQVWVEIADVSKPPIDAARRDLSRPARLHWLAGRRSPDGGWDAYEAPDGTAWAAGVAERPWSQVKHQLLDLVNELAYSAEDGTRPTLALDRVWMRDNGHIVLLDFAPPAAAPHTTANLTPEQLLQAAAARVPRYPSQPDALPLSARAFLERWSSSALPGIADARAALLAMTATPNDVHWWRRAVPGTLAAAPVACALLVALTLVPVLARFAGAETSEMMNLLGALKSTTLPANSPLREPEVRAAAEVAIAGRYAHMIRDDGFWNAGVVRGLAPDYRRLAEEILARHADVSPAQLAAADAILKDARERRPGSGRREQSSVELGGVIISTITAGALALVLLVCVISSLLVPGGLVSRQLGLATVTRSGREISRVRSLMRVLVAGIPAMVWLSYLAFSPRVQDFVPTPPDPVFATLVTVGVLAVGLGWTIVRRTRGPHDLLTGTWVVPR
jgi:hypothetical protein